MAINAVSVQSAHHAGTTGLVLADAALKRRQVALGEVAPGDIL